LPANSAIDAESFNRFFVKKVAKVGASTANTPQPTFSPQCTATFTSVMARDVVKAIRQLPDKFSATDPLPTSTLKQAVDLLAPFIVEVFNQSLVRGHFPVAFKKAFITPMLKKPGMDATDVSSYQLILNLPVLPKLLEHLVVHQLINYLLPVNQSRFRPGHSTESAVLLVLLDILWGGCSDPSGSVCCLRHS